MKEYIWRDGPRDLSVRVRREVLSHFNVERISSVALKDFDPEALKGPNFGNKSVLELRKWIMDHQPIPIRTLIPADEKPVLQFRVRRPIYLALALEAERDGRSLSGQAEWLLEEALLRQLSRKRAVKLKSYPQPRGAQ